MISIITQSVRMKGGFFGSFTGTRNCIDPSEHNVRLIQFEAFLRERAYRNAPITTRTSFFDDSDMNEDYCLVVVYDSHSLTPLLSCRYYYSRKKIIESLAGDEGILPALSCNGKTFDLNNYSENSILLADRLSANISSSLYRENRNSILFSFYREIVKNNDGSLILLMVRENKQVEKYFKIGFSKLGTSVLKGKEHSIIIGDTNDAAQFKN